MTGVTGGDRREGGQVGEGEILVNRRVDHSEVTQEVLADLKKCTKYKCASKYPCKKTLVAIIHVRAR